MKIKFGLSIIFSLLVMQSGYSQGEKIDTFYSAVGIDASFINNFLPFDNPIGLRGNYLFHYFKYNENGNFTKHALDFDLAGDFEKNESDIDKNDARLNIQYKIGRGKRKNAFKKAYVLYGAELLVDYGLNRRSNIDPSDPDEENYNKNFDQIWSTAIGPAVGFGYNILDRLSIYTEAGAYLRFSYTIDDFESELNPDSNFNDRKFSINSLFRFPRSFILFYHF